MSSKDQEYILNDGRSRPAGDSRRDQSDRRSAHNPESSSIYAQPQYDSRQDPMALRSGSGYYNGGQSNRTPSEQRLIGGVPPAFQQHSNARDRDVPSNQQPFWTSPFSAPQRSDPSPVVSSRTGSQRATRGARGDSVQYGPRPGPELGGGVGEVLKYAMERFIKEQQRMEEPWKLVNNFRYSQGGDTGQDGSATGRR